MGRNPRRPANECEYTKKLPSIMQDDGKFRPLEICQLYFAIRDLIRSCEKPRVNPTRTQNTKAGTNDGAAVSKCAGSRRVL